MKYIYYIPKNIQHSCTNYDKIKYLMVSKVHRFCKPLSIYCINTSIFSSKHNFEKLDFSEFNLVVSILISY